MAALTCFVFRIIFFAFFIHFFSLISYFRFNTKRSPDKHKKKSYNYKESFDSHLIGSENIKNFDEKIYISCYGAPANITEISLSIYGKLSFRRLSPAYKKMEEEKQIEVFPFSELPDALKQKIPLESGDRRSSTSIYCYAKSEKLLNEIVSDLKGKGISLDTNEKGVLKTLLDSDEFREYVFKHINRYREKFSTLEEYPKNFSLIKEALSRHCSITIRYDNLIEKSLSNEIIIKKLLREELSNKNIIPEISILIEGMNKIIVKKLSRLDEAVNSEVDGLFDMVTLFNEESLKIYNK